jgi:predicted flap endonuclease-1-like 5' DNA nuclease
MERAECNRNCWISAAIAGVVVLLFVSGLGATHWLGGLFLGLVTFVLAGPLLVWLLCHAMPLPVPPLEAVPAEDWQRRLADSQPEALLVSASLPEMPGPTQMPLRAVSASDDLQRIKGVGPRISDWLNANGVTGYEQIAGWDAADVADFVRRMGRMGSRIEADDWVGQARILAAGGETEHSRRLDSRDGQA